MASAETWTIRRLLEWTTEFLGRHGSESARLDAEVLLAHVRGSKRIELYVAFDEVPNDAMRAQFRELVKRRSEGVPVAYLVGQREFYSLAFDVSPAVLIPRPETEFVIVTLLDLVKQRPADSPPPRLIDMGTGSGILAVSAAKHVPTAEVTAVDVSPEALAVARGNAAKHGLAERIELFESDLFAAVPSDRTFDFVLSNPPYISEAEFAKLARDVKDHEPRLALVAGPTGTEVIARLIPQAAERLVPGGWLLMEISPMIETAVHGLLAADGRFANLATVKDLAGLARIVKAQRK